jgi:hypothetical protein
MSVTQDLLHVTKYEVLGKLPDLFTFDDGTSVATPADWDRRRREIYKTAVELQYGTLPPKPEFLEVETLFVGAKNRSYRIHTGTKAHPVSFLMKLVLPGGGYNFPAIVDGDMCFGYYTNPAYLDAARKNGIAWAFFDRTELAHDIQGEGLRKGQLYDAYPDYSFGALGAWAWGYSRCVDALEKIPLADLSTLAFTGHSRGGKTAMLAGVLDRRATIVNPNETCAGGCSCYRLHIKATYEGADKIRRSEPLKDIFRAFPFWFGAGMEEYIDREQDLPFDSHYLKAMVAPRTLFVSEAAHDIWANPVGSWQTTMAAKEVYRFLGAEDNLFWYFRSGTHFHEVQDVEMLVNLMLYKMGKGELSDDFFHRPFPYREPIYDWRAPEREN